MDQRWTLEGVEAPHDLTVIAAPIRWAGSERPLAFLVGETRLSGSQLHKFVLKAEGMPPNTHARFLVASHVCKPSMSCSLWSLTARLPKSGCLCNVQ